jgi:hypothetical protein
MGVVWCVGGDWLLLLLLLLCGTVCGVVWCGGEWEVECVRAWVVGGRSGWGIKWRRFFLTSIRGGREADDCIVMLGFVFFLACFSGGGGWWGQ